MLNYTLRRVLQIIPVMFIISLLVFLMMHMIPGDPVKNMMGMEASKEAIEAERERLGLNDPLYVQYVNFMKNVIHGDLGTSIFSKQSVTQEILERYPYTAKLALGGTLFAAIVGILIGITCAVKRNSITDSSLVVISLAAVSTPSFFLALIMLLIFSLNLGWLPSVGLKTPLHYILPVITLGMQSVGLIARTTRSAMLDVLTQDYIRTSRSRGIPKNVIIYCHYFSYSLTTPSTLTNSEIVVMPLSIWLIHD